MTSESINKLTFWVNTIVYQSPFSRVADLFLEATTEIGRMIDGFLATAQAQSPEVMLAKKTEIELLQIGQKLELFQGFYVERKDDGSLVTTADLRADEIGRTHLGRLVFDSSDGFSEHRPPVISEEDEEVKRRSLIASLISEGGPKTRRIFALIDPLDVTNAYINRITGASSTDSGHYSSNLALVVDGIPVVGVLSIYDNGVDIYTDGGEARLSRYENCDGVRVEQGSVRPKAVSQDSSESADHLRIAISYKSESEEKVKALLADYYPTIDTFKDGGTLRILRLVQGAAHVAYSGEGMKWWDVGASIAICLSLGYSVFIPEDREMPSIYDTEASLPELYFGSRSILQNVGLKEVFSPEQYREILENYRVKQGWVDQTNQDREQSKGHSWEI